MIFCARVLCDWGDDNYGNDDDDDVTMMMMMIIIITIMILTIMMLKTAILCFLPSIHCPTNCHPLASCHNIAYYLQHASDVLGRCSSTIHFNRS